MLQLHREPDRNFVLREDGRELGRLIYPKWWSARAEILLPEGIYDVRSKKWHSATVVAELHGVPIIEARFPWNGSIEVDRVAGQPGKLKVKYRSIWKAQHVVIDEEGNERMHLRSRMSWKMDRDHEIEKMGDPPLIPLEILMIAHALNVRHRRAAGHAG